MLSIWCMFLTGIFGGLLVYLVRIVKPYVLACIGRWSGRLPPGPPSYPIVGTMGIDDEEPWLLMKAWNERYGRDGLFTFFLGPQLQVVICDVEVTRTLYKDPRLDGRPDTNLLRAFKGHAVAFSQGSVWKDVRKFEIMALKDFGRGSGSKNLLEEYVQQAATDLVADIQEAATTGKPFSTRPALLKCVANSIASTLCGTSLRSDDPRFARLTENVNIVFTEGTTPNSPLNVFPWLSIFPPFRQQQAKLDERMNETVEMIQAVVNEHRKHFDPDNVRDFMDAFIKEQARHQDDPSSPFTDKMLTYMSVEMYFAGLDATLGTLQWAILLLSSSPEVQAKCQTEIDAMLGSTKMAAYSERNLLPYCEATMNEVSRIGVVDPFGLPHRCLEDTPVLSYIIPKDATVFVNYYGIHMSEEIWQDPFTFRPERFLDEQGKFQANPNSLPFATGRRMCSGDNFGKMMVFISMVSLLQCFTFQRAEPGPWSEIKRINGVGVHPDKFCVTAVSR